MHVYQSTKNLSFNFFKLDGALIMIENDTNKVFISTQDGWIELEDMLTKRLIRFQENKINEG